MKFLLKSIKYIILLLILVVVVGIFGVIWGINSIARSGIEKGATYALGVPTKVGSASVGIMSSSLTLSTLNVSNPSGFEGKHFLALGNGNVAVSLSTLRQDTVVVPTFALTDLDV